MGGDGLMVATSKDGFVWAKAAAAVSARQIVTFLSIFGIPSSVPYFWLPLGSVAVPDSLRQEKNRSASREQSRRRLFLESHGV